MKVDTLFAPDRHAPFHDKRRVAEFLRFAKAERPRLIVDLGDGGDATGLSRFPKDMHTLMRASPEREQQFMEEFWRACAALAETRALAGNHMQRWAKLMGQQPHVAAYVPDPYVTLAKSCGVRYRRGGLIRLDGGAFACHGDERPARAEAKARKTGRSIAQGDSHHLVLTWLAPDWWALEAGHLVRESAPVFHYSLGAAQRINGWTPGFGWIDSEGVPHVERL